MNLSPPPQPPLRQVVGVLGSLYTAQYLGTGFLYFGLVSILRRQGVALEQLAALQLVGIVWALKFLWAPLLDAFGARTNGHYRRWILLLQPLLALSTLALLLVPAPADQLGALSVIVAFYALTSATQDIAVDALAVRSVSAEHRGLANGLAGAGSWFGNILGGGLVVLVYDLAGWAVAVLTLSALTAIPTLAMISFREPVEEAPTELARDRFRQTWSSIGTVFTQPGCRSWAFLAMPLFLTGVTAAYGLITVALVDSGWSLSAIGILMGIVIGVPAMLASVGSGWLVGRFGRSRMLMATGILAAVATVMLYPLMSLGGSAPTVIASICVYVAAMAAASTLVYTVNMDFSRPRSAGSDFTVLASVATLFSFVAGAAMTWLAAWIGYVNVSLFGAALALAGTAVAVRHARRSQMVKVSEAPGHPGAHDTGVAAATQGHRPQSV